MPKPKKQRWIGSAQVLVDIAGYSRAILIHEDFGIYRLIGPLGCCGKGVDKIQDRTGSESSLKRLIERELKEAGYYLRGLHD